MVKMSARPGHAAKRRRAVRRQKGKRVDIGTLVGEAIASTTRQLKKEGKSDKEIAPALALATAMALVLTHPFAYDAFYGDGVRRVVRK